MISIGMGVYALLIISFEYIIVNIKNISKPKPRFA